jgi:hypothetical protein
MDTVKIGSNSFKSYDFTHNGQAVFDLDFFNARWRRVRTFGLRTYGEQVLATLGMNACGSRVTNVAAPITNADAATKKYADDAVSDTATKQYVDDAVAGAVAGAVSNAKAYADNKVTALFDRLAAASAVAAAMAQEEVPFPGEHDRGRNSCPGLRGDAGSDHAGVTLPGDFHPPRLYFFRCHVGCPTGHSRWARRTRRRSISVPGR